MMTTVMIVDNHPIVSAWMRAILDAASNIQILGEGANGAAALRLVDELRPFMLDTLGLAATLRSLAGDL